MPSSKSQQALSEDPCFTDLWLAAQRVLGGYVYLHLGDHFQTEDIIQEVARQATENFDQYDPSRPFTAWLIGIARQRIAEMHRKNNRKPIVFSSDLVDSISEAFVEMQPEIDHRIQALRECQGRLSERHLRVLELRYARQLSVEEIAEQVGGSTRSIVAMLHRIRVALRRCITRNLEATK